MALRRAQRDRPRLRARIRFRQPRLLGPQLHPVQPPQRAHRGPRLAVTSEYTLSFGQRIGTRGFYKATWVDRDVDDIVEDQIFFENGQTEIFSDESQPALDGGFFGDNRSTATATLDRKYEALQIQGDYRLTDHWRLAGNYTYQLKNEGNYVGEATNQPVLASSIDDYPEMFNGRNVSYGRLPSIRSTR